jgi:hypothetical protein
MYIVPKLIIDLRAKLADSERMAEELAQALEASKRVIGQALSRYRAAKEKK